MNFRTAEVPARASRSLVFRKSVATILLSILPSQAVMAQTPPERPAATPSPERAAAQSTIATDLTFFGPQRYVRTAGPKDVYTTTITVPSWLKSPFRLHVDNGAPNGSDRISSGTVAINGTEILSQRDFNQNVGSLDRTVTLTPSSQLVVTLASKPQSYLTIGLFGASADLTMPSLTWFQPPPGATVNSATPRLVLRYDDVVGTGEPAASGVDPSTLSVSIDGVDRSALFVRRSDEATAELPQSASLVPGVHSFKASIADHARNRREITGQFTVDAIAPTISVAAPAAGSYIATQAPPIVVRYLDETALDLSSLRISINGTDRTALFNATATEATIVWNGAFRLPEGPNSIAARIADRGGNEATASLSFNVDVKAPQLAIAQPANGSRFGSGDVAVKLVYSDDQALALNTAAATVDGQPIVLTSESGGASAVTPRLADGPHVVSATISDRAGNAATVSSSFTVDSTVPRITVVEPPAGANIKTNQPRVSLEYSDQQGIDTTSLKVSINDVDRTMLFVQPNASAAAGVVEGFTLPEGVNRIAAEIRDLAANTGRTLSNFFVDTVVPSGTIDAPGATVSSATPALSVTYADNGSGVDPASVRVFVDGSLRTGIVTATSAGASGTIQPALADGSHEVRVTFADHAGNSTTLTTAFVVDATKPSLAIVVPQHDAFINTTNPALRITYADAGTGLDLQSFRLFLKQGDGQEKDVTSFVTAGPLEAIGLVPQVDALGDGTYRLRSVIRDLAGNTATAEAAFEVDTAAPVYEIETPPANGYVSSTTPALLIRYSDTLSGVDLATARVRIDGIDRTARFTFSPGSASGTLLPEDALSQGRHTVDLTLSDRAGNRAPVTPQFFTVDTIAPEATISQPANSSFIGAAPHAFRAALADPNGSGVDPTTVRVFIDGVDRTPEFTITATEVSAQIATPLADGAHSVTIRAYDWAANLVSSSSSFTVDSTPPRVAVTAPAPGAWLKQTNVPVSGTVTETSPVVVEVNGILVSVTNGAYSAMIPATDGTFVIRAVARDAAGNVGTAETTVNVDSAAPVITIAEPAPGLITKSATVRIAGSIADGSAVTATLGGQPLPLTTNTFSIEVPLASEGDNTFTVAATDAAGNIASKSVIVKRDTVAPTVAVVTPVRDTVIGSMPLAVSGTVVDANRTAVTVNGTAATVNESAWHVAIPTLGERKQTLAIVATDAAGNVTTISHDLTVDLTAPLLVILAPTAGTVTKDATTPVSGTATDISLVSVKSGAVTATLEAGSGPDEKKFMFTGLPLADGDNTLRVIATDATSRTTEASVLVTRDSVAPSITVAGPDQITRSRSAKLVATATDNLGIKEVTFSLGETLLGRDASAPYDFNFNAPATSQVGDTITIRATATDRAGNTATATKLLRFVAEGAIVGQVLNDRTGLPIEGAIVRLAGAQPAETRTDARGRYAFPINDQTATITTTAVIGDTPTLTVERTIVVQSGVGTVPVDARLTPLGPPITVGPSGLQLRRDGITIEVPSGAVPTATTFRVTPLTLQGLPNLLPLGWSPIAAFDVFAEAPLVTPTTLTATLSGLPGSAATLVAYRRQTHAWSVVRSVVISSGIATTALAELGTYALVVADDANVPPPVAGETLAGVEMKAIPSTATSAGSVNPPTLPTTGGSAVGTIVITSPEPLPSGTVVQAEVTEEFSMANGEVASQEKRTEDLILYRVGQDVRASFPIVPSRSFAPNELLEGTVHLDILAGREAVRGKTGGGMQALTLTAGAVRLTVPAGALPADVAIVARPSILSSFLPSTPAATPLAEVVVEFSGFTLTTAAELSVSAAGVAASESVVIARVERVFGVPRLVVVAATERVADRFVSKQLTGFDGIYRDGRFVFYRVGVSWGIVTGTVAPASPNTLVQADALPFTAIANTGSFALIAPSGSARITASVPNTSLAATSVIGVSAGQTVSASFGLAPTQSTATVTPTNGATRVPVSTQIEISASAPLGASTGNAVVVREESGAPVATRAVFSASMRSLAIIPMVALKPGITYRVTFDGLVDAFGGAVVIAPLSFTTAPEEAPAYDTERIVFTSPNSSGNVRVSAPAGSLPAGTRVMIVNSGNGVVVSYTVANDGSFSGEFPASIDDRLIVTITDPKGNVVTFERSKFVFTDGSGRVAIGPGGGTVEGTGGTGLIIPEGALDAGVVFTVTHFGPEKYSERPDFPDMKFGSGINIHSPQTPTLKKEGDLIFPKPADAPDGAFYYVFRRIVPKNGVGPVLFETVDHAFPTADGKVVTASYPLAGWNDSIASWEQTANAQSVGFGVAADVAMYLMWTFDALLPGLPTPGAVAGHTYKIVYEDGNPEPEYIGLDYAEVKAVAPDGQVANGNTTIAISRNGGRFVLWDRYYRGGTVQVTAKHEDAVAQVTGTAYQANPLDTKLWTKILLQRYLHVANASLTFSVADDQPIADASIHVMSLTQQMQRQDINGIAIQNTPLLIGFKLKDGVDAQIINVTINDEPIGIMADNGLVGTGMLMDYRSSALYQSNATGQHKIKATVVNPFGGPPLPIEHTFLMVAAGGNNYAPLNGPPDWITRKLVPRPGDAGIPLNVLPQITFTEPVKNILAGLSFTSSTNRPMRYIVSAVALGAGNTPVAIPDLQNAPDAAVTSITVQPIGGLEFGATYTIALSSAIVDLDTDSNGNPAPKSFPARSYQFSTSAPTALGTPPTAFASAGLVILGQHAFITRRTTAPNGLVHAYDISDIVDPAIVGSAPVSGQPMDISGELSSPLAEEGPAILVGSGLKFSPAGPSNIYVYDVRNPAQPKRVAAVSLTEGPQQGTVLRVLLKRNFAYTITYPHGIQIIDLQRAKHLHDQWSDTSLDRHKMSLALVTEGVGFAQDAVTQSIRVPHNGSTAHLLDLQAGDYVVNGQLRRLIFATGSAPFVVVDPGDGAPVKTTSASPTAQGHLEFGRGIGLARVANRDVAVVIGTGVARKNGDGELLTGTSAVMVFDLANPLVPNLIGSFALEQSPSDLVLHGTTAYAATPSGTVAVSFSDPTRLKYLGKVPGTGGRIAISEHGGILGSTNLDEATGGLRTAALIPVVIIERVAPIYTEFQQNQPDGEPTNTAKVHLNPTFPTNIRVRVEPPMTVNGGTLRLTNPLFPKPDGSDGGAGPDQIELLTFIDNAANVVLKQGTYEDTYLRGVATVQTEYGEFVSVPRQMQLGWVKLDLDSNNDTRIDPTDREAARKGRQFGFWESDPEKTLYKIEHRSPWEKAKAAANPDDDLKGLSDYATLRLDVRKFWWSASAPFNVPPIPKGYLRIVVKQPGGGAATWFIAGKEGTGLDYLHVKEVTDQQKALIVRPELPAPPPCSPTLFDFAPVKSECNAVSGEARVPEIGLGLHEFLFRCASCRPLQEGDDTKAADVFLEYSTDERNWKIIDRAKANIRPVTEWMTVMSARQTQTDAKRPLGQLAIAPSPKGGPTIRYANNYFLGDPQMPEDAKRATVLVHGYNIGHPEAVKEFLPAYFKRLYWVGHPVHRLQGDWRKSDEEAGCVRDCAHTIGVSWPSDSLIFPTVELRAFQTGAPLAKYLRSVYEQREDKQRVINVLSHSHGAIVVHSAMARPELISSGATRFISRYVMNQAALAAEALENTYAPSEDEVTLWGERWAELYGFGADTPWKNDYVNMDSKSREKWAKNIVEMQKQGAPLQAPEAGDHPDRMSAREFYENRWRQYRSDPVADNHSGPYSMRGPWRGLYHSNKSRTRMFNTWSANDRVVKVVWRANQFVLKPYSMRGFGSELAEFWQREVAKNILGNIIGASIALPVPEVVEDYAIDQFLDRGVDWDPTREMDNASLQTWSLLKHTTKAEDSVFGDNTPRWNLRRQWAELAYWFPSTSYAAGVRTMDQWMDPACAVDTCETNFTKYSGLGDDVDEPPDTSWSPNLVALLGKALKRNWIGIVIPMPSEAVREAVWGGLMPYSRATHSYLRNGKLTDVWDAWVEVQQMFDPKN